MKTFVVRLQILFDIALELAGIHIGAVSLHHFSLLIDDKFREIPLDEIANKATLLFFQVLPQGMSVLAIDVNFLEQIKLDLQNIVHFKSAVKYSISNQSISQSRVNHQVQLIFTFFRSAKLQISSASPGSWPLNWLQGNARIRNPEKT